MLLNVWLAFLLPTALAGSDVLLSGDNNDFSED